MEESKIQEVCLTKRFVGTFLISNDKYEGVNSLYDISDLAADVG